MSLIHDLQQAGLFLSRNGDKLRVEGPPQLLMSRRDELLERKGELLALLDGDWYAAAIALIDREVDPDRREHLRYVFEERAAVYEFDGGNSRHESERLAYLVLIEGGGR